MESINSAVEVPCEIVNYCAVIDSCILLANLSLSIPILVRLCFTGKLYHAHRVPVLSDVENWVVAKKDHWPYKSWLFFCGFAGAGYYWCPASAEYMTLRRWFQLRSTSIRLQFTSARTILHVRLQLINSGLLQCSLHKCQRDCGYVIVTLTTFDKQSNTIRIPVERTSNRRLAVTDAWDVKIAAAGCVGGWVVAKQLDEWRWSLHFDCCGCRRSGWVRLGPRVHVKFGLCSLCNFSHTVRVELLKIS